MPTRPARWGLHEHLLPDPWVGPSARMGQEGKVDMTKITRLSSELSRLGRESEMLDTIVTMMGDERLDAPAASGTARREVVARLAADGVELAQAVWTALGRTDTAAVAENPGTDDVGQRLRDSHRVFCAAAEHLPELGDDAVIEHSGLALRPVDVVSHRIAEVVLANGDVSSTWTLDEADPDSVRDALDAMVRRLEGRHDVPSLTLATLEGDEWRLHGGGERVFGTRESLAGWLARGDADDIDATDLPRLPQWA
ncbi:MAG TPA: hypothetical protein VIW24_10775 [Aldersonia sp.]